MQTKLDGHAEEIRALAEANVLLKDIAARFGVCYPTVRKFLKARGFRLPVWDRSGANNPNWQNIWEIRRPKLELWCREPASLSEMARRFHCNKRHVRAAIARFQIPYTPPGQAGERSPKWKGGKIIGRYIRVYSPDHPHRNSHNYVPEHRLVMEKHLGRFLLPSEVVHHKDKNPLNNALENLQLFSSNGEHLKAELTGHCPKWSADGKQKIVQQCRRNAVKRRIANRAA